MMGARYTILVMMLIAGILFSIPPVSAVKSYEQSVGDSLTRGGRFTVTITALPNSSYYVWIPHTSSMTGEPRDQPPVIADNQANVAQDPENGPYTIGSYRYSNGGGQTIRDDIAPSTADLSNTRYYALVTTDHAGQATVEFLTSVNTGLRSYSVRVENPRSVDSDNLFVELRVFSRRAPSPVEIFTVPETERTTVQQTTAVVSLPPETTSFQTTIPEPVQTTVPPTVPTTKKAPIGIGTCIAAAGVCLLLKKEYRQSCGR
ncbi:MULTISPECIES: hypothetical protein [unclassified Methanoregula]|uniref:hypothetical protein n=1 Tax=unclassified Methanoregula TaxID=2649730 RepID=UPI0009D2EB5B|nr:MULTISPECIES: hypothetical protein [unclassified Methanoregula]OPX62004.1 MAG: hypothetical protein A4E33_02602 [Methanoregula sp. PtaB.Bin085]OPY34321.1 MAG: hypothetical protein A4E34_01365 [Methanoregula sp. PtaU1.Bin006]